MRFAVALLLAGCSAEVHHTPDGGFPDALPDASASTGTPPANAVTLRVTRGGVAVPGVEVFFQGPDSSSISTLVTNELGVAWAVVPAGGFVTAREHTSMFVDDLTTFSTVQPGDALELAIAPTPSTALSTFTLSVPSSANAAAYKVYSPCGLQTIDSATADVTLNGCANPTDLVIVPIDANGDPVGTQLYAGAVDITKGAVNLQAGTYEAFAKNEYTFANVPVPYLSVYAAFSARFRAFEVNTGIDVSDNIATAQMQMPASGASELTVATEFPTSGVGRETFYDWHAPTTSFSLDIATAQVPRYATSPVLAGHTLTWSESGAGVAPDLVRANIHAYRDGFPQGHTWHWKIAAPRTATTITFPTLPVGDYDFNVKDSDMVGVDELETISLPGGYVAGRAFAPVATTTANGRVVVQSLYFESL